MPGPAGHLTMMELQSQRLQANPALGKPVAKALAAAPTEGNLGSIGPDMLFWADWGGYTPIVNTIFDIYKTVDKVYDAINDLVEPITDAIDKTVNQLTGGLSGQISATTAMVSALINTAMQDLITSQVDYFSTLKPDMQIKGKVTSEVNWNWLDYTHHRRTGAMTQALIQRANASRSDRQRAYAYGWLSHVTGDVLGHPYVNLAVGGPYRSHWQRHFIQEKFMDSWIWGFYHTPGVSMPASVTPGTIPFAYNTWSNVNGSSLHKKIDLGTSLPPEIADLIAGALRDTYFNMPHPNVGGTVPFLGANEVDRAYQMLFEGLEIMTSRDRLVTRPTPPLVFNDDAPPTYPSPGGGSGGGGGGGGFGGDLLSLLAAIAAFIANTLLYVAQLAAWIASQVLTPLTYPVRYALYLIQLGLYEAYRAFRWSLALSGWAYPDPEHLANPIAQQFINPQGQMGIDRPRREFPPEKRNCIGFPLSGSEPMELVSAPYQFGARNYPWAFIEAAPSSIDMEKKLIEAANPKDTIQLVADSMPLFTRLKTTPALLGNAMDFYMRRAGEIESSGGGAKNLQLPDWNLDGDRGYAFKCWKLGSALEPPPVGGVDITYL